MVQIGNKENSGFTLPVRLNCNVHEAVVYFTGFDITLVWLSCFLPEEAALSRESLQETVMPQTLQPLSILHTVWD